MKSHKNLQQKVQYAFLQYAFLEIEQENKEERG